MSADLHLAGESEHQLLPVYMYQATFIWISFPSNTMGNLHLEEEITNILLLLV